MAEEELFAIVLQYKQNYVIKIKILLQFKKLKKEEEVYNSSMVMT